MNWRFLKQIVELVPGERAAAMAVTDFPEELLADHFPSIPVTPGVLLIEMCAQLGGKLVEITASERRGVLILPFLTMVIEAKLRRLLARARSCGSRRCSRRCAKSPPSARGPFVTEARGLRPCP